MILTSLVLILVISLIAGWVASQERQHERHRQQADIQRNTRRRRPKSPVSAVPERFIVVDVETTGLHAHRHEIIEIGAIKIVRDADVHAFFQALILPEKRISTKITQLTGLDRKILSRDGSPIEEIMPQFLEFCEGLPMVAFNAEFDRAFIEAACRKCGCEPPSWNWICALELSRAAWPGRTNYRLSALARDGGLDLDDEHRAIGDCKRTAAIFATAVTELTSP